MKNLTSQAENKFSLYEWIEHVKRKDTQQASQASQDAVSFCNDSEKFVTPRRHKTRHRRHNVTRVFEVKPFPKDWLQKYDEGILERLAIMTVDGHLTDSEALKLLGLE